MYGDAEFLNIRNPVQVCVASMHASSYDCSSKDVSLNDSLFGSSEASSLVSDDSIVEEYRQADIGNGAMRGQGR